jgi:hypothetical protein
MEELASQVYKRSTANVHKVHKIHGKHVIVLDPQLIDTLKIDDETWLMQESDDTGNIRLVAFKDTKDSSRPPVSQQADDQTEGFKSSCVDTH